MPNIWRGLFTLIWYASEYSGVGLGRFAPYVFQEMTGCKGKKV